MKRSRLRISVAILAVLLLSLSGWLYIEHVDPRYNGRRTSEWLRVIQSDSEQEHEQAKQAVSALGERAVPQITRLFFARDNKKSDILFQWIREQIRWKIKKEDADLARANALAAIEIIGGRAESMLPELVDSLGDEVLRQDALSAMGAIGVASVPALKTALHHTNSDVQIEAVRILTNLKQTDIVPRLKEFVQGGVPELRAVSIEALSVLAPTDKGLLSSLRPLLKENNEGVRACAVNALGYIAQSSPALIPEFASFIEDPSVLVRKRVIARLWRFVSRDKAALDAFSVALADNELGIRVYAIAGLCSAMGGLPYYTPDMDFNLQDYENWGLYSFPGDDDPIVKLDLPLSLSEEMLPLLQAHIKTVPGNSFTKSSIPAQAYIAMFLVDHRTRPFFQEILSEIVAKSKFTANPLFGGFRVLSGTSDLPVESWRKIATSMKLIRETDPKAAELINLKILNIHNPPPGWETNLSAP